MSIVCENCSDKESEMHEISTPGGFHNKTLCFNCIVEQAEAYQAMLEDLKGWYKNWYIGEGK